MKRETHQDNGLERDAGWECIHTGWRMTVLTALQGDGRLIPWHNSTPTALHWMQTRLRPVFVKGRDVSKLPKKHIIHTARGAFKVEMHVLAR